MDTSKLKPFNLEDALAGKPVVTRGGRPITQLVRFNGVTDGKNIVGVDSYGEILTFHETGIFHRDKKSSGLDLFMPPTERTVWVNLYQLENETMSHSCYWHDTEEDADRMAGNRIGGKAHPITFEE